MRRRTLILAAPGILAGFLGLFYVLRGPGISPAECLGQAETALKRGQYAEAERLAKQIPSNDEFFCDAMLIAGEAATKLNRLDDAVEHYRSISVDCSEEFLLAQFSLANVLIHTGELSSAINAFRFVLESEPQDVATHSRLAFLYAASARRWECRPHLELVLRSGGATIDELAMLADLERPVDEAEYLKKCRQSYPNDPNVRLGLASAAVQEGQPATAILELEKLIRQQPLLMAAQALLGELLANERSDRFESWNSALTTEASLWPDIWYARGLRAQFLGHSKSAARCFWEVLRISPIHRRANYQLGRVLTELHHPQAEDFSGQARQLFSLTQWLLHATQSEGMNEVVMREIVQTLDQMGRVWESCAWAQVSRQNFPESEWPSSFLQRLAPLLNNHLPMVLPDKNLAMKYDLRSFPEFHEPLEANITVPREIPKSAAEVPIRFREESDIGLDFIYQNAADASTRGARMQEQTGGAVTVVDIDQDSWPDLYFVQGSHWPSGSTVPVPDDRLIDGVYRNRFGRSFQEITSLTGIVEQGFGQSSAAGDLNEDGFEDLYVANIGQNSLLLNNGDGTFSSASLSAESPAHWTSSVAIADVNSDGLSDLVDVNYVAGPDVYTRICSGRACSPSAFSGTLDQVHLSNGDGSFSKVSASTPVAESKGLGLVVFRNPERQVPSIFVANDQTPKFLLTLSSGDDGNWSLNDTAFQTGLGYNGDGLLTAAMGIAADDVNNNGLIDFFVTNFKDEANTLYLQVSRDLFQDLSRAAGLDAAGIPYVSWGTQFLDADRDGDQDLVVTNGHVEDYRDENVDYEMKPQLFRNLGNTQFQEVTAEEAGSFFGEKFLGRGLAKLDWNRDGLMDFAVSNIGAPVSLLTNTTDQAGHFVNFRLHATTTARNAFFARVEVQVGQATWTRQLCAGDGYHASNERLLQFGLGNIAVVQSVRVVWPSGAESIIENPIADSTLELVEGRDMGILWKDQEVFGLKVTKTIPASSQQP